MLPVYTWCDKTRAHQLWGRVMRFVKTFALLFLAVGLSACAAPSPYFEGKSAADVPAQVDVIRLKGVEMIDNGGWSLYDDKGEFKIAKNLSQNDQEVQSIIKRSILNQLNNYGYKVVEDDKTKSDVQMQFFVNYIPEYGIIVNRTVGIFGFLHDQNDQRIFRHLAGDVNTNGLLGALLTSRDDVVSAAAQKVTVQMVTEMQKGTKGKPAEQVMTNNGGQQ